MFLSRDLQDEQHYSWKQRFTLLKRSSNSDMQINQHDHPTPCQYLHGACDNIERLDHIRVLHSEKGYFELVICLQDTLGLFDVFFSNIYLAGMKYFFLGFTVVGRPYVLTLICVECYLATVKPVVFLWFKPLRYKLVLSGIVWFLTWVSCFGSVFVAFVFHPASVLQVAMCCVVQIYCCVCTLLILKQPGPGEGIRQEQGMNSKKQKAFRTILVTTVSVILAYFPLMILMTFNFFVEVEMFSVVFNMCYIFTFFLGFAHSFLFLQRSGKLPCITCPLHASLGVNSMLVEFTHHIVANHQVQDEI